MTTPPDSRISGLSSHLQKNLLMFRGKVPVEPQQARARQLIPAAGIVAVAAVLGLSRRTRNSLFVKLAVLVLTKALQNQAKREQSGP